MDKTTVWRTHTAIYGLVQAPKVWFQTIHSYLLEAQFTPLLSEACIYVKLSASKEIKMILLLYVDDILYCGWSTEVKAFEEAITKRFKIQSNTNANEFIGVQLTQDQAQHRVLVHQKKHIADATEKFELTQHRRVYTPLETTALQNGPSELLPEPRLYQALVGSLNYLSTCSRPDLAFAASHLARSNSKPTYADLQRAKRTLAYVYQTIDYYMPFIPSDLKNITMTTYVDSSLANGLNARSICGYVIYVNKNLVHYKSRMQSITALSSTESEFIALALAVQDNQWIANVLKEMLLQITKRVIYSDNHGAIKIAQSTQSTARTRHLNMKLQYSKETIKNEHFLVRYVQTSDNIADIFTKPLGRIDFTRFAQALLTAPRAKGSDER